jgi:hypothetical protein
MRWTTETWWFDSQHGEFFFPSKSLDRRCGPTIPHSMATPLHLVPPSPAKSLCLNIFIRATPGCLKWTPDVGINWLPSAGTSRIKIGPEVGFHHWAFSIFLRHTGRIIWNSSTAASYHNLSNSAVITHLTIRRYTAWTTDGAVKKHIVHDVSAVSSNPV